jgi:RNA polymerase sigma factor (sigma-70 family)
MEPVLDEPEARAAAAESRSEAAARLFREHNGPLVAYLTSRLRSVQEAKEVAQDAFVRLLQLPWSGGPGRLVRDYLFKTAKHLAIDRLRHQAVRLAAERSEPPAEAVDEHDPLRLLVSGEHAQRLASFMQELPSRTRQVFELHRIEGLSQQEVGRRLLLSERMVRRHVTYVLVYCRLRLDGLSAVQAREKIVL